MKRIIVLSLLASILIFTTVGVITCAPAVTNDEQKAPDYAYPATVTTLEGLSEGNLAKYTQYGNAEFKKAVTQKMLDDIKPNMDEQLGNFVSIKFKSIETKDKYIIVHYQAKYTKSEVGVRMVFDQAHLVAGQWFE